MPGKFHKIKCVLGGGRLKATRGSADSGAVVEALKDSWQDLQNAIKNMNESDKQELKDHFNGFDEDNDDLGDILFGDFNDFEQRINLMDDAASTAYTNELQAQEVIEI